MSFSRLSQGISAVRFVKSCALVMAVGAGAACGASGTAAAADPNAPFAVELTKASVTIVNQTGTSIAEGVLNLVPVGFPRPYFVMLTRMSSGEKRSFPLEGFRMLDGTKFRLNVTKVSSVQITAKDVTGKAHEFEMPVR
jgi:hypothetical protein